MADPFGVTAVALSALKIVHVLHGIITDLKEVPNQRLALSNETCNLKFVLDSVQDLTRCQDTAESFDRQLGPLLFQARVKLDQLENTVSKWCKTNYWGDKVEIKLSGRIGWRGRSSKAWQLQQEICEIRTNLTVLSEANSPSVSTRLSVEIEQLYSETARIYRRHSDSLDSISDQISPISTIHDNSQESVELLRRAITLLERTSLSAGMDSEATVVPLPPSPEGGAARVRFLGPEPVSGAVIVQEPESVSPTLLALPMSRVSPKGLSCAPDCKCACHSRRTFQVIPALETVIGRLFVGYSGLSVRNQSCDLETCQQKQGTPSLNIKVRRPCSEANRLFALSRCEGVDGIKELFSTRAASPDDLDYRAGWTSLHFAIDHGCLKVCKFLLDCGADPEWEDNTGTSPVEVAWRNILHLKAPPKLAEAYAVLFPGTEYLQERRFTHIHNIVIGLEDGNLEDALAVDDSLVNEKDIDGWTPLHWAARRGNSYAVAVLLAHGADPFLLTNNENWGPLHLAAQSTSALSDYKAKTNAGNTILHLSANVGEIPMLSILAKARMYGLDLDARNCDGHTPAKKVELRDEVPQGFRRAWDRLIQSIVNKDFDAGSWATTPASGNESWYSFDDMSWYEAEAVVQEDVKNAEKEQEEEEDRDKEAERATTPESEPKVTEEEMVKELSKRLEEAY
ncbi:uncharacterized protein NECHADRAFT_84030 [Fusarium vanettenii 77-13-4]|uniref:Uncharacterized protein n=1 Tax=Fusarium vanettenii (strain ATCC MYA-4622 / CBS 123669 / FGSC 9596 / NRRL 45880 / 77-13-4) TaxID=660122 RepID=C7YZH3_FUSV7|nr:uncharacterized protein NECHADRAFT_84030 [Fusarium vanettenii 77-13-4]EEU42603.1 hypothetical protein NECHADRAFT_84030 [Fusarium vanettenii 77-13-4]